MNTFIFQIYLILKIHDCPFQQEVVERVRWAGGQASLQTKMKGQDWRLLRVMGNVAQRRGFS